MRKPPAVNRRVLIPLIIVLALLQAAILVYLGILLRPSGPGTAAEVTASPRFQLPSAGTIVPGGARPTATPAPAPVVPEGLIPADDHAALARGFDVEQALEHIAYLAADARGGRQPGTPGGRAAGDYIAARFAEYGLEPAGLNSTYFQTFTLPYGRIVELPTLEVVLPTGEVLTHTYGYRTDYRALTGGYVGAGAGEGRVVWLNRCDHDAFLGQDLVGRIVLCRYTGDFQVYREAVEHRVGGLLLLDREREGPIFRRGGYRETAWVPETIPAYLISERVAEDLLVGTDYTLDDLSLRFTATPLSVTVRMEVRLEELEAVEARNVLALLPGADPERSDEVVIVGAHYDHLGQEPDGEVMRGANDNASGVATMLEIARLWHEAGFRPARTVLFAAWDGEEQGLLGSEYYVENPVLPLSQTVAVLNLDMVGGGEALMVDGEEPVAAQLLASASVFGITATHSSIGRSDHATFIQAGVPAAMPIWWPDEVYHTPDDAAEAIAVEKLQASGVIAAHTLAALADGHVQVERAVERLWAAVATGDRGAFLAGVDPADADLRAAQAGWFDNLWSRELTELVMEPERIRVGEGEARVGLTVAYRWADATRREPSVSYDVRFVKRNGVWVLADYELDTLSGDLVTVARFPDVPVGAGELLSTTQAAYLALAADLGVEPAPGVRVIFYPSSAAMRAIARPAVGRESRWLVPSARRVEIAWGEPVTPALASLLLSQMGLPSEAAPWLREGLALRYRPDVARDLLPALAAAEVVTSSELQWLSAPASPEDESWQAAAWGLAGYLLERHGTAGLRALCAAWKETGNAEAAFQEGLGVSPARFEADWRADWLEPLRADAAAIKAVLDARAGAVLSGDGTGFLGTVTSADPVLRIEEGNWFADLTDHPVLSYTLAGELVGWSPGGGEATVALTVSSAISGGQSSRLTYDARFVREEGGWRYAGVAWRQLRSDHFLLKYQGGDEAWARHVLELAETAYRRVTADLGATPPLPQEIKLYGDGELFRTSISLSLPGWVTGWTEPGESIKLWLRGESDRAILQTLAHELAHQVLFARGLEDHWLQEGVAAYEGGQVTPMGEHWTAARYMPVVQDAVRRHQELPLDSLPSFEELPDGQVELAYAQSWSVVAYVAERYGQAGLRRLIERAVGAGDLATALERALGVDPAAFQEGWREYALNSGVPEELVGVAQRFDAGRALDDIALLSGPDWGGREAGTEGADRAAAYIAEQFAAAGLEPLGDLLAEGKRGYFQWFPISHTQMLTIPAFALLDGEGQVALALEYRRDFVERSGAGEVEGELVWVRGRDLEGLRFGGAVVLEQGVDDPPARATELAERGAGGLIVVTEEESSALALTPLRPGLEGDAPIPVFVLGKEGFERLLAHVGVEYSDLAASPPALPLGVRVRLSLPRTPLTTTLTANVLGVWPGSDPGLADEVLIVGAHYDHIGRSPDGVLFPGANHNGSGVAALLEMARVWREAGYRPARTVVFAAWGAEEVGSVGVAHYLAHPALPLTRTVGVVALDGVGGGRGYKLLFYGTREHDLPLIQRLEAGAALLDRRVWRRGSTGEGWHTAFSGQSIPTVKLIWDEAERDFYLPTDTADRIEPDRLASSGEVLTLMVAWLAGR